MKTITIKLPETQAKELDDFVKKKNYLSKSEFIRHLIMEKLEKNKKEKRVKLNAGDVLVLQPFDIHKIIKASNKNEMLVTCVPDWREEDEINVE